MSIIKEVLDQWYFRVCVTQRAHYLSADCFERRKYWLGVPAVALSTIVGTSIFATLEQQPELWLKIAVGLASVAAALFSSLQTFLGYAERSEKHRIAGAKYGALGRELEALRASLPDGASAEQIAHVREQLDALAIESLNSPQPIYLKAEAEWSKALGDHE